ncbi:transmembrane protein 70 homolog, mitochondrial [Neocloeon triangulifer]|uniref:transmembrane protein 70 homolog, mitochondrial n=1 Tax=Neocloeon triangulifer TaxID=2078957 RepID=UPI00286EFC94|nr:transmembrane protein 70 homolog, mitochondrial [Neocloeon triangulifer]
MAQSLKLLVRSISSHKNLLLAKRVPIFPSRNGSNSCFLCGNTKQLKTPPAKVLQSGQPRILSLNNLCRFSSTSSPPNSSDENVDKKIYQGSLVSQVKSIKYFTIGTSIMGCIIQPVIWTRFIEMYGAGTTYTMASFIGFFTIVTPLLIHYITKKYVTDMYYNSETETYTAVTLSFLNGRVETKFKQEDVFRPDMLGMFESFRVNGKPLLVDSSLFFNPEDYGKLMGYDKPIDFTYFEDKEKK